MKTLSTRINSFGKEWSEIQAIKDFQERETKTAHFLELMDAENLSILEQEFKRLKEDERPLLALSKQGTIEILRLKSVTKDGTTVKEVSTAEIWPDLKEFGQLINSGNLPDWYRKVELLNIILVMDNMVDILEKYQPKNDIEAKAKRIYFANGKMSKTKVKALVTEILTEMYGEGFRCTNRDLEGLKKTVLKFEPRRDQPLLTSVKIAPWVNKCFGKWLYTTVSKKEVCVHLHERKLSHLDDLLPEKNAQ